MIVLLITQKEYIMDFINHYIKLLNLNIKLVIHLKIPDNYDLYDVIITDDYQLSIQKNIPVVYLLENNHQWVRSYNTYGIQWPLDYNQWESMILGFYKKKKEVYPWVHNGDNNYFYNQQWTQSLEKLDAIKQIFFNNAENSKNHMVNTIHSLEEKINYIYMNARKEQWDSIVEESIKNYQKNFQQTIEKTIDILWEEKSKQWYQKLENIYDSLMELKNFHRGKLDDNKSSNYLMSNNYPSEKIANNIHDEMNNKTKIVNFTKEKGLSKWSIINSDKTKVNNENSIIKNNFQESKNNKAINTPIKKFKYQINKGSWDLTIANYEVIKTTMINFMELMDHYGCKNISIINIFGCENKEKVFFKISVINGEFWSYELLHYLQKNGIFS